VDINSGMFNASAPFGSFKQSGNGRENGFTALKSFTNSKRCSSSQQPQAVVDKPGCGTDHMSPSTALPGLRKLVLQQKLFVARTTP
jgi:hypothetical protein